MLTFYSIRLHVAIFIDVQFLSREDDVNPVVMFQCCCLFQIRNFCNDAVSFKFWFESLTDENAIIRVPKRCSSSQYKKDEKEYHVFLTTFNVTVSLDMYSKKVLKFMFRSLTWSLMFE